MLCFVQCYVFVQCCVLRNGMFYEMMFFVKCYVLCNVKFLWNFFFSVVFLWNVFWECCVLCSVVFHENVVCIILCVVKRVLLYFVFCAMLYFVQCYVFWNVLFCFVLFYFEPQGHCRQRCVAHLWQCSVGICHVWRPWHMISIIFIFMEPCSGTPCLRCRSIICYVSPSACHPSGCQLHQEDICPTR